MISSRDTGTAKGIHFLLRVLIFVFLTCRLINYLEFSKSLDDLFLDDDKAKEILSATQFEKKIQKVFFN